MTGQPAFAPTRFVRRQLLARAAQVRLLDGAALDAAATGALAPPAGVPSPCVSVCRMDAGGTLCQGCARTLDEIAGWSRMGHAARQQVWRRIEARLAEAPTPSD